MKKSFGGIFSPQFINKIKSCKMVRNYGVEAEVAKSLKTEYSRKMRGWQIHSYGDLDELQFSENLRMPTIVSPNEVIVKVKATGINPIDVSMLGGYGSKLLNILRFSEDGIEFPLTLGREFSGVICQKGLGSSNDLKIGDNVWGVVPIQRNGCHAEYVAVSENCISKHPKELTTTEAGGMLYTGLTAWSGIFISGALGGIAGVCGQKTNSAKGKRILVLGASGGVGSAAVQILKAEKCSVVASCATDAVPIVKSLGADRVIDYTNPDELDYFAKCGPYEIILDCAGLGAEYANKFGWSYKSYVTFSSPMLRNVDKYGLPAGMLKNLADIIESNAKSITTKQGLVKWAYFVPSQVGINYLNSLVERKKFLPLIDETFEFTNMADAFKKVKQGHLRGKVIINVEKGNGEC